MLMTIVFLKCFVLTLGLNMNEMTNKDDLLEQHLTQSWETQQFVGGRSLVEEESADELVVLRERRETGNSEEEASVEACGCGEIDICAEAELNNCSTNADCEKTDGSYICHCRSGFYGDGETCKKEVNQCNCSTDAHCIINTGSYICKCKEGFYGNGTMCEEILITTVMTTLGGTAVLICTLNENRVIWKKNGNIVKNSTKLIIFKNLLIIKEVSEDDFGEYVCDIKSYENATITIKLEKISEHAQIPFEYVIPLIILAILFLFSIMVIAYLVYSGKKKLATAQEMENGERDNEGNDPYEMVQINPMRPEMNTYDENIYSGLSTDRGEESIYQGLVEQSASTSAGSVQAGRSSVYENLGEVGKGDGDKEKTEAQSIYEPLDLDCKTKV